MDRIFSNRGGGEGAWLHIEWLGFKSLSDTDFSSSSWDSPSLSRPKNSYKICFGVKYTSLNVDLITENKLSSLIRWRKLYYFEWRSKQRKKVKFESNLKMPKKGMVFCPLSGYSPFLRPLKYSMRHSEFLQCLIFFPIPNNPIDFLKTRTWNWISKINRLKLLRRLKSLLCYFICITANCKNILAMQTLVFTFCEILLLIHSFIPFKKIFLSFFLIHSFFYSLFFSIYKRNCIWLHFNSNLRFHKKKIEGTFYYKQFTVKFSPFLLKLPSILQKNKVDRRLSYSHNPNSISIKHAS